MIFNREDIQFYTQYSDSNGTIYYRLHKPSGVFFAEHWDQGEHHYFEVAALTKEGKRTDAKYFYKNTQEQFFEAVKYFESLISKRTPTPKQNPPSMGIFVFSKGDKLASFIKISDLVVDMSNEDVYKAFTPPKTKPFGKLDITILDDPKYDPVKYKFACNYDEKLSKELAETAKVSIDELFVYQLTAYQTQEGSESNPEDPASVSDEQLKPGDIEGETPQDLKGNPDDSGQDQQPGDDQGGEPGDDQGGEPGDEKGGEPGDDQGGDFGDDEGGEPTDDDGGEPTDDDGREPGDDDGGEPGDDTDGQRKKGRFTDPDDRSTARGYETDQTRVDVDPIEFRDKLNRFLGVEDVAYAYGKQERLIKKLDSLNSSTLSPLFQELGLKGDAFANKTRLLEEVTKITKPYFE